MSLKRIIIPLLAAMTFASCGGSGVKYASICGGATEIYPDYMGVTVPATIAPLDFSYVVEVPRNSRTTFSTGGFSFSVKGRKVRIGEGKWHKLLSSAKGGEITVRSEALQKEWKIFVSEDEIDYGLNYRLIEPSYEKTSNTGIFERNLSNYDQVSLLRNTEFVGCCNCHSHCKGDPSQMSMHIRGDKGCTLILKDGELQAFSTKTDSTISKCVYTFWHPSGDYIAYSTNISKQQFHVTKEKVLEVVDQKGDVVVYDIRNNQLILSPKTMQGRYVESFPSFSPDGRTLYFSRMDTQVSGRDITKVRYELCNIGFDPEAGSIGDSLSVLVNTADIGDGSVCFPKPSPDGRYVMFTRSDYGIFASWHHEADLWLLDLQTGALRPLDEVNSADSEGCHAWSTNGRWFAFGSRRDDGLYTRAYIAHFDPSTGRCGKPFMLPQRDPEAYYSELFYSYNIPEFVTGPNEFDRVKARKLINQGRKDDPSEGRVQFGYRLQGKADDFDALTGSSVPPTNESPVN